MADFKKYRRTAIAEMVDWEPGFDMTGVSVSEADAKAGSPKPGDKIARNPKNHDDRWLVAADYFADNFALLEDEPAEAEREPDYDDDLDALAMRLTDFRDAGGDPTELAIAIEWLIRLFIARHEIEAHPNLRTQEAEEPCRIYEYDGAFKCHTHNRLWGAVRDPDEPCVDLEPEPPGNHWRTQEAEPVGWQKCPVCGGRGEVPGDFYPQYGTSSFETLCRTCKGRTIIPVGQPLDGGSDE